MFGLGIVILVAPAALVALIVSLVLLAVSARPDARLTSEVASARQHAVSTSVLACLAAATAVVVPVILSQVGDLGLSSRGQACVPLAATAAALAVLAVGELTWPRPRGGTRTAVLHDRSAATVLPRGWTATAAGLSALAIVAMLLGGVLGASDGRSISRQTATTGRVSGPFPGWHYVVPQLAVLAICGVLVLLVVRAAVRRSSVVSASVDADRLLRSASAARAMRALATGILVTLGADLVYGGLAASHVLVGLPRTLAAAALVLGLVSVVAALATALVPVPRLPAADPRPAPSSLPA